LSRIPGVTWVVGNSHKTLIGEIVAPIRETESTPFHGMVHVGDIAASAEFLSAPITDAFGDRTRPNLKIQDGCSNVCSFCIIPSVRGRSRSMPLAQVVEQVRHLSRNYREIVITGVNLGRWGRERGFASEAPIRLAGLLRLLLDQTGVERLRLSSVEPMDFSDDLLSLMAASPRIARHVHAPLQSGSDSVLRRMKRKYRVRHYEDRIRRAHALMPDAAFGADVMTGFPGETADEFQQTLDFIERLPFTYLHVFTYSERPGTPAAGLPQVPHPVRKERTRILRALGERKNREFRRRMLGRTLSAVTLDGNKALSGNYLQIHLARPRPARSRRPEHPRLLPQMQKAAEAMPGGFPALVDTCYERRRRISARPSRAVPTSAYVPGSGTGDVWVRFDCAPAMKSSMPNPSARVLLPVLKNSTLVIGFDASLMMLKKATVPSPFFGVIVWVVLNGRETPPAKFTWKVAP
jgi:threonylcarbamoyladenosine tRNA methylthiotransferase MtaB